MKLAFAVCLLSLFACAMAADIPATGQAKLLYVRSIVSAYPDSFQQITKFHVEVQNIAYEKYVAIHLKNPQTGVWQDLALSWRSAGAINPSDSTQSTDVFTGDLSITTTDAKKTGPVEFVVKYSVAGNTYWQKNATSGQNYIIPADFGAILTNGQEIYAGDYQTQITQYYPTDTSVTKNNVQFLLYVKKQNAQGQEYKSVNVRYTDNAWKTYADVACYLSSKIWLGWYSQAQNPNAAGYEAFECTVPVSVGATTLEYSAHLQYQGASYEIWDNNWGRNYKTAIVWKKN